MKFAGFVSFVNIAVVSTQLVSNQQESTGFIQSQNKSNEIHNASSARPCRNHVVSGSETRGRDESINFDILNENKRKSDATDVKAIPRTDQRPMVFTNINRDNYNHNVKHIQRLNSDSQLDKVIFKDEVNYDQEPFTNRRRLEDHTTHNTGRSTQPSVSPSTEKLNSSRTQPERSLKGNTSMGSDNVSRNKTLEGNSKINKDESTRVEVDLENRVAFTGDVCPTGLVKVEGKCVKNMS